MFKQKASVIINCHRAVDILITIIAFVSSYFLKKYYLPEPLRGLSQDPNYYSILMMVIILWYFSFNLFDLYRSYRHQKLIGILWDTIKAIATGVILLGSAIYILKLPHVNRMMIFIFIVLNVCMLGLSKTTVYFLIKKYRKRAYHLKNIIIAGQIEGIQKIVDIVRSHADGEVRIIDCVSVDPECVGSTICDNIKIDCTINELDHILRNKAVDEIIFAIPMDEIKRIEKHITVAEEMGICVRFLPEWMIRSHKLNPMIGSIHIEETFGVSTLTLTTTTTRQGELFIKGLIDYIFATTLLILTTPVIPLIFVVIRISSKGPILYRQERLGLNGRKFIVYKFRTMGEDAEQKRETLEEYNEVDGPVFKIPNDPRIITYIGHLFRKTHLDELPQLINILRGEMSLVGPRPPIPDEVKKYDIWQRRRLSMKPGLTCLWQISERKHEMGFEEWMNLDLKYIDNWSLFLDIKIFMKTLWIVLKCSGR